MYSKILKTSEASKKAWLSRDKAVPKQTKVKEKLKPIPSASDLAKYGTSPKFQEKYETDPVRVALYNGLYAKVSSAWKSAYYKPPGGVAGSQALFSALHTAVDKVLPGTFDKPTFVKIVAKEFDKGKSGMDIWDVLTEAAYKKTVV